MLNKALSNNKYLIVIFLIYGTIYSSISFVNHYLFRTYALDLGILNKVLYDYATFSKNDYSIFFSNCPHHLGDHFSLLIPLISPFYWVFKSYTLLVFQIAAILFGAYGIYKFLVLKYGNTKIALLAVIHFLSIWGIYSALSFDYHDNVIAAMFVPWLFWSFEKYKLKYILIFVLLICIAKENMALWCGFILLGISFQYRNETKKRNLAFLLSFLALLYFVLVIKVVIPSFGYDGITHQLDRYSAIGKNLDDIILNLIKHPINSFELFFNNTDIPQKYYGIKTELHLMILISGGIVFLFRPIWIIILFPIYAQKMWSNNILLWGNYYQYSIEYAPIITLALFSFIASTTIKSVKNNLSVAFFFIITTIAAFIYSVDNNYYNRQNVKFYSLYHYKANFDINEMYYAINLIPKQAAVSAQSFIVPHLCFREKIYEFPNNLNNSNYLFLVNSNSTYPLSQNRFFDYLKKILMDKKWTLIYCKNYTYIFKKVSN